MTDLTRKRERDRLKRRREPYWQRLAAGAALGFRRGPDTWIAKYRSRDGVRHLKALGEALEYYQAKRTAETWLAQMAGSTVRSVKRASVQAALEAYLADLRRHGRPDAAREALWRFKATVYEDPFAELELEALTRDDFLEWRDRTRAGRAARTVNRYARAVAAALNCAVELGHVGNPGAWRVKALADDIEDEGSTAVFLSPEQRKALIAAADPHTAAFLRALEYTGGRPHELAAAMVRDFDGESLRLAHRKGKPPKLRVRHAVLGAEGIAFFRKQAANRLPAAPLLTEDGARAWRRHIWCKNIRAAVAAHNEEAKAKERLPAATSAYAMRHARISELLQVHGVDPLTVAHQTGTSLAMIERAYLRFIPSAMRAKLTAVKGA
jgi:integrase